MNAAQYAAYHVVNYGRVLSKDLRMPPNPELAMSG